MGRPSFAIASTSRITQNDLIAYVFAMIKAGDHTAVYLMEPNAIRHWMDKVRPFNAKIIEKGKKRVIVSGDIFSTPGEFRAGETITAATVEEIRESAMKRRIKLLKANRANSIQVDAEETIEYQHENGDVVFLNCPNGRITLDAIKSEDSALIAQMDREKYLQTIDGLSEKDCVVKYNEVTRNVNTKGAQVANLLKALSDGKLDSAAFAKACAKLDNDSPENKPKSNKSKGTLSVIGTWGR